MQIFYRQIEIRSGGDGDFSKNENHSQNVLVDISQRRDSRKMGVRNHPLSSVSGKEDSSYVSQGSFEKPAHNAKVAGWYIGLNGCGERI